MRMINTAVGNEKIQHTVNDQSGNNDVKQPVRKGVFYQTGEFNQKSNAQNIQEQEREIMQGKNAVVKIPPLFLIVKNPQKESKNREVQKKCFRQIMNRSFDKIPQNISFFCAFFFQLKYFVSKRPIYKIPG